MAIPINIADDPNARFEVVTTAAGNTTQDLLIGGDQTEADSLYYTAEIEGQRWNKFFPYQLMVVSKVQDGGWVADTQVFTLPISPQSLDLDMPFAITTSATLGGVIEEHNGAPFRMISLSSTTGVLPLKGVSPQSPTTNVFKGIFAGTVANTAVLLSDVQRLAGATDKNVVDKSVFFHPESDINKTTGYYQCMLLERFLESYANRKKLDSGKNLRLAFCMWKDRSIYLVTPTNYKRQRTAESPFEYRINLQFKAFGRINLTGFVEPKAGIYKPATRNPNGLAQVINQLAGINRVLQDSRNYLQSFRADIQNSLFEPLREIVLALKTLVGTTYDLTDLPADIIRDTKQSVVSSWPTFTRNPAFTRNLDDEAKALADQITSLSTVSSRQQTDDGYLNDIANNLANKGAEPANKLFANPNDGFLLLSQIKLSQLKLPIPVQRKIKTEANRVASFARKDYEVRRDSFVSVLTDFAASIGHGSDTYNRIYGIKPTATSQKVATDDDFDLIYYLNSLVIQANKLCVSNHMDPGLNDPVSYVAGLARSSGIAFTEPKSKLLVPYLYGHSLEQMALRYLKDANRWHEIAALNGLREPYIDEVGFDLLLTANGSANTVQVSDISNLFVGQSVYIQAASIPAVNRRVTGLRTVAPGVCLVNLSGTSDLSRFTTVGGAVLHAYLPDTVNSSQGIYIPSQEDAGLDWKTKAIPGVNYYDSLVKVGGVSLLLTSSNDILFAGGRSKLAVGLVNIVQKVRIALSTPQGSLLQHPAYGLPVQVGSSTADVDAQAVLRSVQDMFGNDPSFTGVTGIQVVKTGPTVAITANITIAGIGQTLPITAEIR